MILMIDNYDSFTYNLVQYLGELGAEVKVVRNDQITIKEVALLKPNKIVISPGPRSPSLSGICCTVVERFASTIPILGVCLGCQVIAEVFGAKVLRARRPVHGETSRIYHTGSSWFKDIPQGSLVARYHSLVISQNTSIGDLEFIASSEGVVMAISHKKYKRLLGLQFHPESFLTDCGHLYLRNFLEEIK